VILAAQELKSVIFGAGCSLFSLYDMKIRILSVLLLTGSIVASGCSKKESDAEKAAEAMSKAVDQMAAQAGNGAAAATGGANKTPGVAIPSKTLSGFLPKFSGYEPDGEPEVMDMDMNGVKYSHATAKYHGGDGKEINVSIFDYNYIAGLTTAYMSMMNMNMETNEESWHSEKIGGFPAWIDWKKKSNEGTVGIVVNDRIFCIVEGHDGATLDELKSAASGINLSGIASVAK
jgi:hypothetical protein